MRVLYQFDSDHQSKPAHVADQRIGFLQLAQCPHSVLAGFRGARRQIFLFHESDVRERCRAAHRIPAKGREMVAGLVGVGDFRTRRVRAERKSIRDSFRHHQNIRLDSVVLDRKHFSGPSEAGLHLIRDEQNAVAVENLFHFLEVIRRRHDNPAFAHHRLGDERRDIVRSGHAHHFVDCVGAVPCALFRIIRPQRPVGVGGGGEGDSGRVGTALFFARVVSRDAERAPAPAVKARVQGNKFVLAGAEPRELERALDGFRAAVPEKRLSQIAARRDLRDFLREVRYGLHVIEIRRRMDQFFHLRLCRRYDLRIAVARVHDGNAREAIEVFAAVHVRDRGPAGTLDYNRRNRFHKTGHHIIFVFLNGICHGMLSGQRPGQSLQQCALRRAGRIIQKVAEERR